MVRFIVRLGQIAEVRGFFYLWRCWILWVLFRFVVEDFLKLGFDGLVCSGSGHLLELEIDHLFEKWA